MNGFQKVVQFCRENPLVVWMGAFLLLGFLLVMGAVVITL